VVLLSPVIVIGALTGFHKGSSSVAQRVWTMSWLAFGFFTPIFVQLLITPRFGRSNGIMYSITILCLILCGAPAIGGFIVAGEMIKAFGVCINIS